jgi:branched-chain amino acid transport system substrate-binding protein
MALHASAAVYIAFVGALSGPLAVAGRDQLDGFQLAVSHNHGQLGGVDVRMLTFDDGGRPENGARVAARISAARARFVTGFTDTAAALALHEHLRDRRVVMLSSGAAPVTLAGEKCSADFFSAAPADDVVHENAGAIAQGRRYEKAQLIVSTGLRALVESAFRRTFRGDVDVAEYSDETPIAVLIDHIRQSRSAVVYLALGKDAAKRFLSGYDNSGLFHRIPIIVAQIDPNLIEALGASYSGATVSVRWTADAEDERSRAFVDEFTRRYRRAPSIFALQGYDAALMLGETFRAVKGRGLTAEAVGRALAARRVNGPEGSLRLAANGFAVTNWHAWEIFNDAAGKPYLAERESTLNEHVDAHNERCKAR